jgi:hypothetical protein
VPGRVLSSPAWPRPGELCPGRVFSATARPCPPFRASTRPRPPSPGPNPPRLRELRLGELYSAMLRRGLTRFRGMWISPGLASKTSYTQLVGMGSEGFVKIFTVWSSLRDQLYACFSTETVKVDNFTGLTTFTVAASAALRTSRSVHVTCFSIYPTCKAFVCPQFFF